MGLLPLMKKLGFVFLLVSASAFAFSSAAFLRSFMCLILAQSFRKCSVLALFGVVILDMSILFIFFVGRPSILIYSQDDNHQELVERRIHEHERILKMNSRDYGQYSPKPKLVRPPSKLIPN